MVRISTMVVARYKSISPSCPHWMWNTTMTKVEIIPIRFCRVVKIPTNRSRSADDIWQVRRKNVESRIRFKLSDNSYKSNEWHRTRRIFTQSPFIILFLGISNVYGSPIMTLAGAPLTTYSAISNGAIHFPSNDERKSFACPDAHVFQVRQQRC